MKNRTIFLKAGAVAVSGAMLLGLTSCSKAKKEVTAAAQAFGDAITSMDADDILSLTNEDDDSDAALVIQTALSEDSYSDDQNKFINAVSDTMVATVDEDSVEVDDDKASADIVITMVDYESVVDDGDYDNVDDIVSALGDCEDTTDVTFTAEFKYDEDDGWLVSNVDDDDFASIFEFMDYDLGIAPDFSTIIDYNDWFGSTTDSDGNASYMDSSNIELDVWLTEDISDYNCDGLTFTVSKDGTDVLTGGQPNVCSTYIECIYDSTAEGVDVDSNGNLAEGSYTITLLNADGSTISTDTCNVTAASALSSDITSLIDYTDWFTSDSDNTYLSGSSEIEFDVWFTEDISMYDWSSAYFKVEKDGSELTSSGSVNVGSTYVECTFDITDYGDGAYTVTLCAPDGSVIASDSCAVGDATVPSTTTGSSSDTFQIVDSTFGAKIIEAKWWDYDATMPEDGVYCNDTTTLGFSIQVDSEETEEISYSYYFSADGNVDSSITDNPLFTDTIAPTVYANGDAYYNVDYKPTSAPEAGYYICVVSNSDASKQYVIAVSQVVDVASSEYTAN